MIVSHKNTRKPIKKILFLGYNANQTKLLDVLASNGLKVDHTAEKIKEINGYDAVISFGYRHILNHNLIRKAGCPIFNLHMSYLPYNRGAHPNFWSFYDNTPSGVKGLNLSRAYLIQSI